MEQTLQTLQARPGINGNTASDFQEAGYKLYDLAGSTITTFRSLIFEPLNGRNYQHAPESRAADLERIARIYAALEDLQSLAVEMADVGAIVYLRGSNK